jgi:hypothetical protein
MKSFLDHLKEEVLPTVQVADGGLDISKPAVRAAINAAIAGVVSQPAVTPYVVFNRLSKLLAQYHIVLPRRFLEGDKGVEVFELRQFGHKMGMTDSGEFVNEVPSTHYLFLQYGILSPFGITYAKPVVGGMFKVMARLVDKEELDKLMDMAEITMAEEAEVNQAIAKANAPREEMHDITSDEKKKGNKEAVSDSQKGLAEAMTRKQKDMAVRRFMSHDPKAGESILAMGKKEREEKKSFASAKKEIKGVKEDKDPCWKGYEMIGMKKKGGKPVPNCVPVKEEEFNAGKSLKDIRDADAAKNPNGPAAMRNKAEDEALERAGKGIAKNVNEEQIDELKKSTLTSYIKKAHVSGLAAADDAANAYHRRDYKELQKQNKTGEKREQGINRAADKLAKEETIAEKAPPGAKFERMVKHIKKGYGKDGLTAKEKSIAYATAWKAKNREKGE